MEQKVQELSQDHVAELAAKREWVVGHYEPHAQNAYESIEGKLRVVQAILSNGWVSAEDTLKLQCLGVAFGDALVQQLGLRWVTVEDEYGSDPSLKLDGTSILMFPLTTISKRVQLGETVDVFGLFEDACVTLKQVTEEGRFPAETA